ncbi:hypothetical protein [Paenibacillus polymyxa]|uniref:hypothetical protein n=1 Tax=Paenibacillus polymyxa TaxID=1406 RepID=UPI002AB435E4|nr:hypothetical protein [Paenibacillus polymyxa]MDY8025034.1 hypothetical protein [Paenibacillus polymyxa]
MEEIETNGVAYKITSRDTDGRINGLKRFNKKTNMWVNLSFSNDVDIDELDKANANLLSNQKNYLFK